MKQLRHNKCPKIREDIDIRCTSSGSGSRHVDMEVCFDKYLLSFKEIIIKVKPVWMFEKLTFAVNLVGCFDVTKWEISALTYRFLVSPVFRSNSHIVVSRKVLLNLLKMSQYINFVRKLKWTTKQD